MKGERVDGYSSDMNESPTFAIDVDSSVVLRECPKTIETNG